MKHTLPPLPYSKDALAPFMSAETLEYHHGKHHQAYVDKVNELSAGTPFAGMALEDIIRTATGPLFNHAAQAWNHNFFWKSMTPEHHHISGDLLARIDRDFGSLDKFQEKVVAIGKEHFGSGWLWLLEENGTLRLQTTHDADTPIKHHQHPLMACDLWEHAYYIDYRNDRPRFLENFAEIINWDFVAGRLKRVESRAA